MHHSTIRNTARGQASGFYRPPSAQLYDRAAALVGMGAWSCDLATHRLTWTQGVFDLFAIPRDTPIHREDIVAMYAEKSRAVMEPLRAEAILARSGFTMDARILRLDGQERWMRLTVGVGLSGGRATSLYGMKQDITQERLEWERLRLLAGSDALTGLANRHRFQTEFLDRALEAAGTAPLGALILFDLDGFKQVNDNWGHGAGDACLATFARRLVAAFPEAQLAARIGGDEFAMLLPPDSNDRALEASIRRRMPGLCAPAIWTDRWLPMGASAGMAIPPQPHRVDAAALYHAADQALYRAKKAGTNLLVRAGRAGL